MSWRRMTVNTKLIPVDVLTGRSEQGQRWGNWHIVQLDERTAVFGARNHVL